MEHNFILLLAWRRFLSFWSDSKNLGGSSASRFCLRGIWWSKRRWRCYKINERSVRKEHLSNCTICSPPPRLSDKMTVWNWVDNFEKFVKMLQSSLVLQNFPELFATSKPHQNYCKLVSRTNLNSNVVLAVPMEAQWFFTWNINVLRKKEYNFVIIVSKLTKMARYGQKVPLPRWFWCGLHLLVNL